MAAYATVSDVEDRLLRTLSSDEEALCGTLLDDAAVIIDTYNVNASADAKKIVSSSRDSVRVIRSLTSATVA